ncbi:hypothetical protein ACHHYP_08449 [Achlya hypogyna]|uniref:Glycosyl transferase family 1 domain-containing protein n=1 Tax=Achlya hypogyna TaxID=1202772 RepID=A0A1V9ZKP1_ACHHY|nr:hypothetical protein ACHHYP_08449 [Achlya hypogyna]
MRARLAPSYNRFILCGVVCVLTFQLLGGSQLLSSQSLRQGDKSAPTLLSTRDHIVHLNNLNEMCFHEREALIPWTYNSSDVEPAFVWLKEQPPSPKLLLYLADCPSIDVFLPLGIRNHGYCEDGMAYVKFLKSRALPQWVLDMTFEYQGRANMTYFDLCPHSAMLFMNHYTDGVLERPSFPEHKKVVVMPNVEMYEMKTFQYYRADYILCKTQDAFDRLTKYREFGNPRGTVVLYVEHTSSDPVTGAETYAAAHPAFPPIQRKDFQNPTFFHANGNSAQKSTDVILDCWASRPDLPPLVLYTMGEDTSDHYEWLREQNHSLSNVQFHYGEDVDAPHFGKLLAEAPVILCPSRMEGYGRRWILALTSGSFGHYINQARAAGALVVTTNGAPMNEFVDTDSGVLVDALEAEPDPNQMLSIYGTMDFRVTKETLCEAVDQVLELTAAERAQRGRRGRQKYEHQLLAFMSNMENSLLRSHRFYYAFLVGAAVVVLLLQALGASRLAPAPRAMRRIVVRKELSLTDHIMHLNNLNEICLHEKKAVISWTYNSSAVDPSSVWTPTNTPDALLIEFLAQCPEVDVYLPKGLRNHGYCEDGMAYVKFLKSRALPEWVLDLKFDYQGRKGMTYLELCRSSAMLFMNHYTEGVPERPDFPKDKKIILMPNVEMYELTAERYTQADIVLCKTRDAYNRLHRWYNEFGNPRNTTLLYTQHTSSDPTTVARAHAAAHPELSPLRPKNFENITIFHANGHSAQKSTKSIFQCWQKRPDLPPIDIYSMHPGTKVDFDEVFNGSVPASVRFHYGEDVDAPAFGRMLVEASTILCPSKMEGFGHYINQARASGALVLATNGTPMNEFVEIGAGVLIEARPLGPNPDQMLSMYGAMEFDVASDFICDAVDKVLAMTPAERARHGRNGRLLYEKQFLAFKKNMHKLRAALVG